MLSAYLNVSDLNIIVVDWGNAAMVNYILASYNVASVGRILTEFLNFLIGEGVSMDDVHLIGHSLGAHVVGIAGAYIKEGPIDTITGENICLRASYSRLCFFCKHILMIHCNTQTYSKHLCSSHRFLFSVLN